MLMQAGAIQQAGTVEAGNTVCDFEQEEKEHGHSLNAAFVNFTHEGKSFNVVDTPGAPDFIGQAIGVMPAVETAAVVVSADKGIQTVTRRIMAVAKERKLPRMVIVNKVAEHASDIPTLVEQIKETFGAECVPLNAPNENCTDVIDLWERTEGQTLLGGADELHTAIVDQCVEVDDKLMDIYLDQGSSLSKDQLHDAFEKALREAHLVPILFTDAKEGTGIEDMLHLMANLCPNPEEGNPRPFELVEAGETKEWNASSKTDDTLVGHVFKVTADQFVGKVSMLRIHQGVLKHGANVQLGDNRKPIRLTHLYKVHGSEVTEIDAAGPGDIVAVSKVDELVYNSVIHESQNDNLETLHFKPLPMPRPMYGIAIEAKSHADETKVAGALHKLLEEDPTFKVERVTATKQTVAYAMGELHMRVVLEKLDHRFKVELNTETPKVAYKESIRGNGDAKYRHKKQTGGAGQFGEVSLKVEPISGNSEDATDGLLFVDETVGGSIPRQFMPAIEKGIRQAMTDGAIAGYPVTDVCVRVYDGKHHPVDSKEVAFISAGKRAFIEAFAQAKPVLLEPFCDIEITAPASAMGDISADLSTKRGQLGGTDYLPGDMVLIHAKAPLAEMRNYAPQLKSITGGQGTFTMHYSHDEPTPAHVQQEIVAAFEPGHDDD